MTNEGAKAPSLVGGNIMSVRMPLVKTFTVAMNGTSAVFLAGIDVRGYGDITIHATNGSASQALTLSVFCDPTGTTVPTATTNLNRLNVRAGTIDSPVIAASGKGSYPLNGLSANMLAISGVLAGAGTENAVITITANPQSLGGGPIIGS